MAMNRIMGTEAQKMQDYAREQIERAERRGITFPEDVKENIFRYADLIGEEDKVRGLVRNLARATEQSNEEQVQDLLYGAEMEIRELPDETIGRLELLDYGYTADDMVPLRKEAALEYHRTGSKIYCLGTDGSKGEYTSREMILEHNGLFGMEAEEWQRRNEYDRDFDYGYNYTEDPEYSLQEPMRVIDREEALRFYDAGASIYLITVFPRPLYVTERMEIERGPENYQMASTDWERFHNLEWEMKKYPQIQSLREANLLLGTGRTFGIYQIRDGSVGESYEFMNMNFIESHGLQIRKEDYDLVYTADLLGNTSLDDIYEQFNINHPEDFRGHSLSVSDVVVLNDNGHVTAHFVDSMSFPELDSFLNLEEISLDELAYEVDDRYFAIQTTEEGYDYSFYDENFRLIDGGVYENPEQSIEEVADILLKEEGWAGEKIRGEYDKLMEKVEEVEAEVMAEIQKSQGEYKPLAKVEELEESNYNMIDNVLNNLPQKKEPYLEYYAAEYDEFHGMGGYEKSTDLSKIAAIYEKYQEDPESSYKICGMGIIYRDPEDSLFDETELGIVRGTTIHGDALDDVRFLRDQPVVREGIEKIREVFPDYRYIPIHDVREAMYPEKMTTEELAEALDEIAEDFDPYDYRDHIEPGENTIQEVMLDLQSGNIGSYISYLKDIVEEECEQSIRAGVLIERLKTYEPELQKELEPMAYVNYCENRELMNPRCQKLADLDAQVAGQDKEWYADRNPKSNEPTMTAQMFFTVYYAEKGDKFLHHFKGKIDIGTGNGGIISQLKLQNEMRLTDESWISYQKGKGDEEFQKYMEDLTDMQNHILPYLQSFCSLEEKGVQERREQQVAEKRENRAMMKQPAVEAKNDNNERMESSSRNAKQGVKKASVSDKEKKPSIHERLEINKKKIQEKQGKDKPERGADRGVR